MRHIVIGTAGHVDHGKTRLVKALTGTDTDALPEEKRRGLTIEPGFAALELPGGLRAGVVDVPGHEKFISNMLSGAAGIDLVLLCVDALEGFMPQTREHLGICALLGVQNGVLALTKADLLDEAGQKAAIEAAKREIRGTFLENAPVLAVSAKTGAGLDALRAVLGQMAEKTPQRDATGPFCMHLDRTFSVDGFGTVVTGTIFSGAAAAGDALLLYPGERPVRVRGLQSHGADAARLEAGERAALNLAGVELARVHRGDTLAEPGALTLTEWADGSLTLLPDAPFSVKSGSRLRFYHGTRSLLCRCTLRGRGELKSGESCPVRLRFDQPVAARTGDRFVVRFLSPVCTVGGGTLLELNPVRRQVREDDDPAQRALALLGAYHARHPLAPGVSRAELGGQIPAPVIEALEGQKRLRLKGPYAFLPGFRPKYTPELAKIRDRAELLYRRAGCAGALNGEVEAGFGSDAAGYREVLPRLLRDGVLVSLDGRYSIHRDALERARTCLLHLFGEAPRVTLAQYRDALGCGRDAALRLLEYFDRAGTTKREENARILIRKDDFSC